MWQRYRPTLVAGVCSCMLHLSLLGIAASLPITVSSHAPEILKVTLLQHATPLPVQEVAGGPKEVPSEPPQTIVTKPKPSPQRVLPKPPVVKKAPPLPKKTSQVKKEPPLVRKEKPPLVFPPPIPESAPVRSTLDSTTSRELRTLTEAGGNGTQDTSSVQGSGGLATARQQNHGLGQGPGTGNLARPDYNVNPKPPYPLVARRLGAQGEVLLRVRVREDGSVAEVELARSSGFAFLDESATRTVRENWRFIPARLDGAPIESWVEVPIKFVLAGS